MDYLLRTRIRDCPRRGQALPLRAVHQVTEAVRPRREGKVAPGDDPQRDRGPGTRAVEPMRHARPRPVRSKTVEGALLASPASL